MIRFACPSCQKAITAPDGSSGRKAMCPGCQTTLLVPPPVHAFDVAVSCPNCQRLITLPESEKSLLLECRECCHRFRPSDCHMLRVRQEEPGESEPLPPALPTYYERSRPFAYLWRSLGILAALVLSGPVGYLSAHHFALYGGFVLMGKPGSPARQSLVPGHILLWALLLGGAGFLVGWVLDRLTRR